MYDFSGWPSAAVTPVFWIDMDHTAVLTTRPVCMDGIPVGFQAVPCRNDGLLPHEPQPVSPHL